MRFAGATAVVVLVAVISTVAGSAKDLPGTTYVDKGAGYSITVPTTWKTIPRSVPAVQELITKLKKKKATAALGAYYAKLLANKSGRSDLTTYVFQAFAWPDSVNSPVPIEVSVGVVPVSKPITAKQLPAIGNEFAQAFLAIKGAKVTKPKLVKLPAGTSVMYQGYVPVGTSYTDGLKMFLIPHGKVLYEIGFRIEGSELATAKLFDSIAQTFKPA